MSELRLDPTTREWVIIATERAKRPHDLISRVPHLLPEAHVAECPFCPGHEAMTTGESASYPDPATGLWRVRVFENKFPAVRPDGSADRFQDHPLALSVKGVGLHEVVVESALHNRILALMEDDEVYDVVRAYRDRLREMHTREYVRQVIIFKNHGLAAGTSLEHPHSQIVGAPVVPRHLRHQYDVATQHYDERGRNLYEEMVQFEVERGLRVVHESESFVEMHPYASRRPFETWIVPKNTSASFAGVSDDELRRFGCALRDALRRLYLGLNNPDFNHVIHTAAVGDEGEPHLCWHLRIYPRLTAVAGFEIGSGIHINTSVPEDTARYMREVSLGDVRG
jgi:UDPglucose--hexose-1-phosphate uridylyltransferase